MAGDHGVPGWNPSGAPFSDLHFVTSFLEKFKSGVDDRGHRLRSGSPVTIYPRVAVNISSLLRWFYVKSRYLTG